MKYLLIILLAATAAAFAEDAKPDAAKKPNYFEEQVMQWIVGPTDQQRMQDPLRFLAMDMNDVGYDLSAMNTDKPVQQEEKQVVAHLDDIIKRLEKQMSGSGNSGSRNPTRPMNSSRIAGGPGGQGELIRPKEDGKEWGQLPAKLREQILQSHTEGFPPGYETILQSYYQRLAQEKVAGDGAEAPAASTTRPARK